MSRPLVVLVSEDIALGDLIRRLVDSIGNLRLQIVRNLDETWSHIVSDSVSLVIAHLAGAGQPRTTLKFLQKIKETRKAISTLCISEKDAPEQSLELFRSGIVDNLGRPLCSNRLSYLIDMVTLRARFEMRGSQTAEVRQAPAVGSPAVGSAAVGNFTFAATEPMGSLMEQVRKVAPLNTTILLQGETGSGKTRLARLIHDLSGRQPHPFLLVNCGSLSSNLIESELFGHVKGAFTSAYESHGGKFAEVGCGTLLLDDIDTLSLDLQTKLLRVVEERLFEPVGSNKSQPMLGRLIVASNRNLREYVTAGRFRSDLYYRLNVIGFFLPPLRQRRSVIAPLAQQFLRTYAATHKRAARSIAPAALQLLEAHDWPGNIRELQNVLEQAAALCDEPEIQPNDLSGVLRQSSSDPGANSESDATSSRPGVEPKPSLAKIREQSELLSITEALARWNNNRLRVASELGISRMTLYKKLRKYGLMHSRYRSSTCG